jgi:hypothetical protein
MFLDEDDLVDTAIEDLISQLKSNPNVKIDNQVDTISKKLLTNNLAEATFDDSSSDIPKIGENDVRTQLGKMTISQKIKAAMFGSSTVRGILIQDPNRLIQQFVLKNPQLSMDELTEFSRSPNTPAGVLRTINQNDAWMKNYTLKLGLVSNPKTPIELSLKWVKFLVANDLKKLAKSKNIPQTLSVTARKKLIELDKRK